MHARAALGHAGLEYVASEHAEWIYVARLHAARVNAERAHVEQKDAVWAYVMPGPCYEGQVILVIVVHMRYTAVALAGEQRGLYITEEYTLSYTQLLKHHGVTKLVLPVL